MEKGNFPWIILLYPLHGASYCKSVTYKKKFKNHCGVENTLSFWQRYSKVSRGSDFVKISTIFSFVPTCSTLILFSATYSLGK
jgi:hypothetical protein